MAFAMPMMASEIIYSQTETTPIAEGDDVGFAARAPPLAVPNVAATGSVTVTQGSAFALHEQETVAALFGFGVDLNATNTAGAGRFRPSQPLDAAGNPIVRTNDRSGVLVQPNGSVTCAQHSCGMVLNTRGNPVAVDDIIRSNPPSSASGTTIRDTQIILRDNGVTSVGHKPF